MSLPKPPVNAPLLNGNVVSREWLLFFQNLSDGDPGEDWNPAYTGLTVVGSLAHTGRFYRISRNLQYFFATITSVGGGTSASVAGTTYINNWPSMILKDSSVFASNSTTNLGIGVGIAKAANNRIYTPAWSATTNTITICGILNGI
jgi:hypothetical protein